jgi:hypothetical protein
VRLWYRSSSLRSELILLSPIVIVLAWHFGVATRYRQPSDAVDQFYLWSTVQTKAQWTIREFYRYGGRLDRLLPLLYLASLVTFVRGRAWREAFKHQAVIESLALGTAFFVLYLVLPFEYSDATFVDVRALAPAALFLLIACLQLPPRSASEAKSGVLFDGVLLAMALSILNLSYLEKHFREAAVWARNYRLLVAELPVGARVLSVDTSPSLWRLHLYGHAASTAVIERRAMIPNLFSANTGEPMIYFRYVDHPYAPRDSWYNARPPEIDWQKIACAYQYILVTRPFDLRRISVLTSAVADTSSGSLLAIDPRACGEYPEPH